MTLTSNPSNGNSYALAFLRIGVGILFLIFGQYKVFGTTFTLHGGFQFWINKFLEGGTYPFMAPILRGFVLPHATSIAFLVRHTGAFRKFLRHHFYAHDALLFGLSRRGSGLLAILRREPEPLGVCAMFRWISDWPRGRDLVDKDSLEKPPFPVV